ISLIMRNKPGIDNLDVDDLYNQINVYEADIKGSFISSSNSQNVVFISAESTSSTNELNVAYSVSSATGHSSQVQESTSSTNELNVAYSVSSATGHSSQKTSKKLEFHGKEQVGFDKTMVECFNCHRRGLFIIDFRSFRNSGNKSRVAKNAGYRGRNNGTRPVIEEDENALVVKDGLGTYDWSYQVEEEATDFALMAFTSNPSSSSSSNSKEALHMTPSGGASVDAIGGGGG
nr:hypothetical protein [Tanacetum cinerariifolium]